MHCVTALTLGSLAVIGFAGLLVFPDLRTTRRTQLPDRTCQTAAAAATQAHEFATAKGKAEIKAATRKATEESRKAKKSGNSLADTPENDKAKDDLFWWREGAQ